MALLAAVEALLWLGAVVLDVPLLPAPPAHLGLGAVGGHVTLGEHVKSQFYEYLQGGPLYWPHQNLAKSKIKTRFPCQSFKLDTPNIQNVCKEAVTTTKEPKD